MINNLNIFLLLMMTLFGATGGVFFKKYSTKKMIFLFGGLFFYGLGALLNIFLLKLLPYSVVVLSNSLTYVWALVFAYFIFREKIGLYKLMGISLILCGVDIFSALGFNQKVN